MTRCWKFRATAADVWVATLVELKEIVGFRAKVAFGWRLETVLAHSRTFITRALTRRRSA